MYSFSNRVRYSEVNSEKELTLPSLLDYLQDCCTFESEDFGVGVDYLAKEQVPFVVFVEDSNYSVELDFMEGIGVVEIAISQNGSVIYSSSENILSPLRKYLQLPFGVSGEYCIEIKGDNGAYAYGCFEL